MVKRDAVVAAGVEGKSGKTQITINGRTLAKKGKGKKHVWEKCRDRQFGVSDAESSRVETELSE